LEEEAIASQQPGAQTPPATATESAPASDEGAEKEIQRLKRVDRIEVTFTEAGIRQSLGPTLPTVEDTKDSGDSNSPATDKKDTKATSGDSSGQAVSAVPQAPSSATAPAEPADDGTIHSGIFRGSVQLTKSAEPVENNEQLEAMPGDILRITYTDDRNLSTDPRMIIADARTIEGNLGGVRVTRAQISDEELRVRTKLKTADALLNIGNRYKEFGLSENSSYKYQSALQVCEEVMQEATQTGGQVLEETYVQLWRIYFAMDQLDLAAV
ncbi:MAG: hypothetical protein ACKO2P_07200, partial [Planctomycetota bacterium]